MAGVLRIIHPDEEKIINRLLSGEGIVLIPEKLARELAKQMNVEYDELEEMYLDAYDYGGEADKWVDIVRTMDHICIDYIQQELQQKNAK